MKLFKDIGMKLFQNLDGLFSAHNYRIVQEFIYGHASSTIHGLFSRDNDRIFSRLYAHVSTANDALFSRTNGRINPRVCGYISNAIHGLFSSDNDGIIFKSLWL